MEHIFILHFRAYFRHIECEISDIIVQKTIRSTYIIINHNYILLTEITPMRFGIYSQDFKLK